MANQIHLHLNTCVPNADAVELERIVKLYLHEQGFEPGQMAFGATFHVCVEIAETPNQRLAKVVEGLLRRLAELAED